MRLKKSKHSFPSFTHVVELDLYFENPEMIEGEKQTELFVNPLIQNSYGCFSK